MAQGLFYRSEHICSCGVRREFNHGGPLGHVGTEGTASNDPAGKHCHAWIEDKATRVEVRYPQPTNGIV